jgi:hypothetical protein
MSLKIVEGNFNKRELDLAHDFPGILRQLADDADAGRITSAALVWTQDNQFCLSTPSSVEATLVLSALLHRRAVDKLLK